MKEWRKCFLGEALTLQRGFDLPERERVPGVVPIVSSSGITGYHNISMVKAPGVVTGRYGTIGQVFYIKHDFWPLNTSLYIKDFKGNSKKFISYFLKIYLSANQNAAGAVPGVNRNHLHKILISLPSLTIQRKIAAILSAYDDLIENNNRRIAILEKMAEELYREWFVRLRFPGHEKVKIIKGVPEGWEVKRISEIVDFLSGYSFKSETYVQLGNFGIVTIKNVQDGLFITECTDFINDPPSNMKNHCYLETGDLLMSLTGNVGRLCHVIGRNYLLNQRVAKIVAIEKYSSQFVYYSFRNSSMVQLVENLSLGSTAQLNLSPIQLGKQSLIFPNEVVLKKFEQIGQPFIQEKLSLLGKSYLFKQSRDRLLSRLMSGKIDVENLDIQFPRSMKEEKADA
jgi:type I restriction enzyme S subunit